MRGLGGPLLCIGDLLADVGDAPDAADVDADADTVNPSVTFQDHPSRLTHLFQEHYRELTDALADIDEAQTQTQTQTQAQAEDRSWTCLTLKLCSAVATATKLLHSTNSNLMLLSQKVSQLDFIINKADSAIAHVRSIHTSLSRSFSNTLP